ncbi:MAG: hypothetical protein LIR50_17765 [Bacillota bacterium]|nr:hypothetical protein [Bacillota bacterium]
MENIIPILLTIVLVILISYKVKSKKTKIDFDSFSEDGRIRKEIIDEYYNLLDTTYDLYRRNIISYTEYKFRLRFLREKYAKKLGITAEEFDDIIR